MIHKLKILALLLSLITATNAFAQDEKYYSIEARDASLPDILRMLVQMQNKNVVIPNDILGKVTVSFRSARLSDALTAILESNGLGQVAKNEILQISTVENLEKQGRDLVTKTIPLKYAKAQDIGDQVKSLISSRGSVMVDKRTNAVTVRDSLAKLADVEFLINNIDKRDRQVLIEGKIVEASTEFAKNVGIQWGVSRDEGGLQFSGLSGVGQSNAGRDFVVNMPGSGLNGGGPVGGIGVALGKIKGIITDFQLSAAEERGDLNILSRPSIATLNNEAAQIHSGITFFVKTSGDVTIGGSSASSDSSSLQEINAGITMSVTPQITIDNRIILDVEVTESQPDFSATVDGVPSIIDNNAKTTILLEDGETTVIGGLFQIQKTRSKRGVPLFERIPLLGALFRQKTRSGTRKELLVFIRPSIVKDQLTQLPSYLDYQKDVIELHNYSKKKKRKKKDPTTHYKPTYMGHQTVGLNKIKKKSKTKKAPEVQEVKKKRKRRSNSKYGR